ncbi:hypothetical protein Hanom_Chr09g00839551 [Helianthus anomalus]
MIHFIIRNQTSFYSRISNQTSQWNGMIHFIPLPRPFHYLVHSIPSFIPLPHTKQTLNEFVVRKKEKKNRGEYIMSGC